MSGAAFRLLGLILVDEADVLRQIASGIDIDAETFDTLLIAQHAACTPVSVNIDRISFAPTRLLVVGHCTGLAVDSVLQVQRGKDTFIGVLCFQSEILVVGRFQVGVTSRDIQRITVVGW